jgi:hypothetical protein
MDLNINHYSIDELFHLLELKPEDSLGDLEDKVKLYIEKFKNDNPELSKFFVQVKETLMEFFQQHEESGSEQEDEMKETDINKIVPQDYPTYGSYGAKNTNNINSSNNTTQVFPDTTAPGTLNPLFKKKYKKVVVIDSKYRDNYFKTSVNNFHITFPNAISNVLKMMVTNVDIINAHYTINPRDGTNEMNIKILDSSGNLTWDIPIDIEPGNYRADDLATEINSQIQLFLGNNEQNIDTLFPSDIKDNSSNEIKNHILKCKISPISQRTIFTLAPQQNHNIVDASYAELQLDFKNPIQRRTGQEIPPFFTLGWILGFRESVYSGAKAYKSESLFNATGRQSIFVSVDDFNRNASDNISIYHKDNFFSKNILARVPLRDGKFSINFNDMSDDANRTREYYGPVNINKLHIQLLDLYGMPFDNNDMDYTLVLEFDCMYQI